MDEVFVLFQDAQECPISNAMRRALTTRSISSGKRRTLETAKVFQEAKIPVQVVKFPQGELFYPFTQSLFYWGECHGCG